jgi:hypothetical protein
MALHVVVREELVEVKTTWRLEVAARGTFAADGSLRLEVMRAEMRTSAPGGGSEVATDDPPEVRAKRTPDEQAKARLLQSLVGAGVRIGFDPKDGVVSVEGLDRAFANAAPVEGDVVGLGTICSDERWRRDLAAAGLCAVPAAVRGGGSFERRARIRVPGRGETTMRFEGAVGRDDSGLPAARAEGRLAADAAFDGPPGALPPAEIGAVSVSGVVATATTTYPPETGPPIKGEFTLTLPFERGLTERTTTTFTLVRL